ncbi:unnamed protein product [Symbiodinium sp. CCMP2592]|nr:unnamed protein product [Symbiodinium sp. CCMP2592]
MVAELWSGSQGSVREQGPADPQRREKVEERAVERLARRLQREADHEEQAQNEGQEEVEVREARAAPTFDFSYLEGLALQSGSRNNLAAVPETREFVDDERSLWTGLEPRDRNSVNYKRAQKAREAVFRGTPFAQRFLEDRPGKQARVSFARDRAVERVASGARAATASHPATTVYESSEEGDNTVETMEADLERKRDSSALEDHLIYAVRVSTTKSEKQPWERGDILAPRPAFTSSFPSVGRPQVAAQVLSAPGSASSKAATTSVAVKVLGKLPATKGPSWEEKLTDNRRAAVAKWEALLMAHGAHFACYREVSSDAGAGRRADLVQTLKDCFAGKASATLHSRVGPMTRYVKFTKSAGFEAFPLTESVLYAFMDQYCRAAAATFGRSFLESLNFSVHVLGLDLHVTISGRIQGVAKARYLEKRKAVQKPALTVLHVRTLEKIVMGSTIEEYSGFDRHCAGFFCYTLYSRARFSDAQASANLLLDITENEDGPYGFLEASVTRSKTSYTLERKTRYLPMVAPINGLLDESWGTAWYELMKSRGILRELLRRELGDTLEIRKLGTHSLKRTLLSWLAKYGTEQGVRAILGYHSTHCGTELVYARDTLSGPLRQLGSVISAVALDHFRPDSTRSGYFPSRKDAGFDPNAPEQEELDSSSSGSDDEEAPDHDEVEKACDALASWEPRPGLREMIGEGRALSFTRDRREVNAVFSDKVRTSGLSAADQSNVLAGLKNLKQLAFVSSYTPGQADEKPLITALDALVKRDTSADLAAQACFRALFQQAYAIVTTEFRQAIERTEDAPSRSLSAPEREERYTRQVKKLTGINIKGEAEPSQALVDLCVNIYESNTLRYVAWEKCTSRHAEVQGDAKKDTRFTLDAQGKTLKLESKAPDDKCQVDSEVHLLQALQRRALALDQANIVDFAVIDVWHQKLLRARMQEVPAGHVRPSFKQLLRADQKLFSELQDRCRAGIQATSAGRPLDGLVPLVMDLSDVAVLLQSLPGNASSSSDVPPGPWVTRERPGPYNREGKGRGKAGKGRAKGKGVLPKPLVGCYSSTNAGEPICFDHNINGCSRVVKNGGSLRAGDCDLDFCRGSWAFNARDGCHSVAPFQGRRVMLIAFSTKGVCDSDPDILSQLQSCGFALPDADAAMPASPLGPLLDIRSSVTHEPLKVLKPAQLVVLDLFCGRGLATQARAAIHLAILAASGDGSPSVRIASTALACSTLGACSCSDPDGSFALSKQYAENFAESLRLQAAGENLLVSPQAGLPDANPSVQKQAKLTKMQPIMPEFKYMVSVHVADCSRLPLDDKKCLRTSLPSVPKGARLLRLAFLGGGCLKPKSLAPLPDAPATATFGVFRTPDEFVAASLRLEHPFDAFAHVPDGLIRNLGRLLIDGPLPVMRRRLDLLNRWSAWANELAEPEKALHASLDPRVGAVLSGKKLLLLDRIAKSLAWPDEDLLSDLKEELDQRSKFLRPALWAKISASKPEDSDAELWSQTLAERDQKSWLSGPYSYQELTEILGPHWIPVRRFAIFQRGKLRCIDDLSENSVNSSWEVAEKIDLRAMDELLWITSRLMQSIVDRGSVNLRLSSGEVISGPLHTVWRTRPESARPVLKCVDLKSAYKQYAIRPRDSKRCVVSLRRPSDGQAFGFISHTLPFGSLASVGQFNRVARLIHRILVELECLACNYYDDYPVLDVSMLSSNTEKTIRKLMRLLGVTCSEDKELPFSSVADLLGVRLDLRAKDFSCVTVANKPDRAREISEAVAKVLSDGQVVVREVDSLFGRIQYADSQIMGRRGKLALSTLRKLSRGSGVHRLSPTDRDAFAVLRMRMDSGEPRRIQVSSSGPSLVVFTDGACEPGAARPLCTVGGVLYASWNGAVKVRYFGATLSDSLVDQWSASGKKHLIGLVELYALVLARFAWGSLLDDRRVLYFIDHVGVLSATINCTSRDELWRSLLVHLEKGLLDFSDVRTCDPGPSCLFCNGRITTLVLTWGYVPRFVTMVTARWGCVCYSTYAVQDVFHECSNPRSHVRKPSDRLHSNFICFLIFDFPHN